MKHPLCRFAPSPSLALLRNAGGRHLQRTQTKRRPSGLAALARGRWHRPRQFYAQPPKQRKADY